MTPPSELPREAGEFWLFRVKQRPEWGTSVGKTAMSDDGLEVKVFSDDYYPIGKELFENYDWHKIQLPEGWK